MSLLKCSGETAGILWIVLEGCAVSLRAFAEGIPERLRSLLACSEHSRLGLCHIRVAMAVRQSNTGVDERYPLRRSVIPLLKWLARTICYEP